MQNELDLEFSEFKRAQMKQCLERVKELGDAEEEFFKQQVREQWVAGMDRNTSYFHAVVRGKRRRSRITGIAREDGTRTSDGHEIKNIMVQYYENLLGSTRLRTEALRMDVMCEGSTVFEVQGKLLTTSFIANKI
ncbi:hypothetical protein Droror1_Dr00017966 [Drosera rotundifolia]